MLSIQLFREGYRDQDSKDNFLYQLLQPPSSQRLATTSSDVSALPHHDAVKIVSLCHSALVAARIMRRWSQLPLVQAHQTPAWRLIPSLRFKLSPCPIAAARSQSRPFAICRSISRCSYLLRFFSWILLFYFYLNIWFKTTLPPALD
jgi:hypothetical protein